MELFSDKIGINFTYPFEQEVGSVGEQPTSDKTDANMVMAV